MKEHLEIKMMNASGEIETVYSCECEHLNAESMDKAEKTPMPDGWPISFTICKP